MSQGAPVEAAVDHAHTYVFATNYSMYGANFGPEGSDDCGGPGGLSPSYVYRVSLKTLAIDKVGQVGMVPKYVAVTPDDKYVLVTNWCSYDLSVLDHDTLQRCSASPSARTRAASRSTRVDARRVRRGDGLVRRRPHRPADVRASRTSAASATRRRHLVLSHDGRRLFVTLNGDNRVVAVDTATGQVVARDHHRLAAAQHGDLVRRTGAVCRELRVEHGVGAEGVRPRASCARSRCRPIRSASRTNRPSIACGSRATAARSSSTTPDRTRGTPRRAVTAGSRPRG